jgi:hypothetical protein
MGKNRKASCTFFFRNTHTLQALFFFNDLSTSFNDLFYNYIFYDRLANRGFATSRLRSEEDGISTNIII